MRVLHVMAGATEGGAENIMLESVLALAQAGVEQAVVTRPDNEFRIRKFRDAGIRTETAGFSRLWPFPTSAAIAKVIREFKPDIAASCSVPMDIDNDGDLDLGLIDEIADMVFIMKNSGTTRPLSRKTATIWSKNCLRGYIRCRFSLVG